MKRSLSAFVCAAVAAVNMNAAVLAADACVYEAESAYTGGWAVREDDPAASSGALVTHVGGTNTDMGTVVFDVWADGAGWYDCEIAYRSRENSSFYLRVNYDGWDTSSDERITTSASGNIVTVSRRVRLNYGHNKVKIYSAEGIESSGGRITRDKRIDVDKITVNAAGREDGAVIENTVSGAGQARRAYMAKDESVSLNAAFDVRVAENGFYRLNVWYSAADFRPMEIYIDGRYHDTIFCPITGEDYNIETVSANIPLALGAHRIAFRNENSRPPEIDKIELIKTVAPREKTASGIREFSNGRVSVKYDMESGKADFISGGEIRAAGFEAAVKLEGAVVDGNGERINSVVKSSDYPTRKIETSELDTGFGKGARFDVISEGDNLPLMRQSFYIYDGLDYILTDVSVSSPDGVSTNFLAPIAASGEDAVNIGEKRDARTLMIPFSNDSWVTYDPQTLKGPHTSYWATCIFDNVSRNAVVAGSVDHDTWKTGTSVYGTADNGSVSFFGAFAGIWSREYTYDFLPHGSLDGETVKSPKMFLGYFDDWRDGMEKYGDANDKNQPRLKWNGGNIFGYSSWNAYGSDVSLSSMKTASDVIDGLEAFNDGDGIQWVNIDSYWDNLTGNNDESQLKEYVAHCKANGQKVGIYTARLICWSDNLWGWGRRGCAITDKYGNAVAPAKPDANNVTTINCFGIDPTSDAAKNETKYWMEHWKELGFEYVKVDFMNFVAIEGVFHDKSVKTGLQAYNAACSEFLKYIEPDKFFVNYSISPLFPHQYAHSRRISCDVWTESGNIDAAKYMLNALNYSWWQSKTIYEFIDPDQISFDARSFTSADTEMARAKYTSAVIAGMMVLSNKYETQTAKNLTRSVTGNEEVNKIARMGRAFRPIDAGGSCPYMNAADPSDIWTLETDDAFYIAVFNFGSSKTEKTIDLERAGLDSGKEYTFKELWTGAKRLTKGVLETGEVSAYGCKLYRTDIKKESKENVYTVENFSMDTETGIFNLTVSEGDEEYKDTVIYACLYDNGELRSVRKFERPEYGSEKRFTVEGAFDMPEESGSGLCAKVFIWRGDMTPLMAVAYEKRFP